MDERIGLEYGGKARRHGGIVRHKKQRAIFFGSDFLDEIENLTGGSEIERAGRFIRQQQRRSAGYGAGHGDPLPLARRQLGRPGMKPLGKPHPYKKISSAAGLLRAGDGSTKTHADQHVFTGGETIEEVKILVNEADGLSSKRIPLARGEANEIRSPHRHHSTRRSEQAGDEIEQGGFSAAAGAGDGELLARTDPPFRQLKRHHLPAGAAQDQSTIFQMNSAVRFLIHDDGFA